MRRNARLDLPHVSQRLHRGAENFQLTHEVNSSFFAKLAEQGEVFGADFDPVLAGLFPSCRAGGETRNNKNY